MNIQTTAFTCAYVIIKLLSVSYGNFAVGTLMRNTF